MKNGYAQVGSAWVKDGTNGKYFSVQLQSPHLIPRDERGNANLRMEKNKFKTAENHPDMRLSLKLPEGWTPPTANKPTPTASIPFRSKPYTPSEQDDIPGL